MGQVIALDTAVLIYYFEDISEFADIVETVMLPIVSGQAMGIFASIGIIELLVKPKRKGLTELETLYRSELATLPNFYVVNLGETIIDKAAELRATYGLRTPDVIHLATAIVSGASLFITNDRRLKKVRGIKVMLLSEMKRGRKSK